MSLEGTPGEHLDVTKIPEDQWTPEMREKAKQTANDVVFVRENNGTTEEAGQEAEVGEQDPVNKLMDPGHVGSVEDAAVRSQGGHKGPSAIEAERQMGIAAADRQQREEKGMEPPVADLR